MKSSITSAFLFCVLSHMTAASLPQATNHGPHGHDLFNIAPAPTAVSKEFELRARALGARQASGSSSAAASGSYSSGAFSKTCGYYDGVLSDPFTCDDPDEDWACAYNNQKNYFGCCPVSAGAFVLSDCPSVNNPYTGCYPYESASICTGACYYQNRVCDSTYPFCGQNLLYTNSATYTAWYCNSVQADALWTIQAQATTSVYPSSTTSSASRSSPSTVSSATSASSRTSTSSSSLTSPTAHSNVIDSTSTTGPTKGSTGTAAGQSSTGTASVTPNTKRGTNVGAIAGGVVGGVVGLALIIGGIAYMLHRKKANERRQSRLEISQVQ